MNIHVVISEETTFILTFSIAVVQYSISEDTIFQYAYNNEKTFNVEIFKKYIEEILIILSENI